MGYKIPQKDVIAEVYIRDYPEKIMTSTKRRTYYKKWKKNMPKKYKGWGKDKEGFLIDKEGNKVVKNTRTAGTPRMYNLRGEDLWSFNIHVQTKSKVSTELKKLYYACFGELRPELFDGKLLGVEMVFHGPVENEEDLDNMERWHQKTLIDA